MLKFFDTYYENHIRIGNDTFSKEGNTLKCSRCFLDKIPYNNAAICKLYGKEEYCTLFGCSARMLYLGRDKRKIKLTKEFLKEIKESNIMDRDVAPCRNGISYKAYTMFREYLKELGEKKQNKFDLEF